MGILGSTLSICSTLFARGSTAAAIRPVATSYMYSLLVITTCIIRRHVRPIVTVVACVVCVSVCWSRPRVLQKRLSRSRCRLRRGLWSRMSHVLRGVWVHPRKMTLWGSYVGMPICGILPAVDIFNLIRQGQQRCCMWLAVLWQLVRLCECTCS